MATQSAQVRPRLFSDRDRAERIAREGVRLIHARRVELAGDALLFTDEVPIPYADQPRRLVYRDTDGGLQRCDIHAFEHKIPVGGETAVHTGDRLVIVWLPYSALRWQAIPFKGSLHDGGEARRRRIERDMGTCADCAQAVAAAEALAFDYWEQGRYLTAGILAAAAPGNPAARGTWRSGQRVRGLVPAGLEAERLLQISARVQHLLHLTEEASFPLRPGVNARLHDRVKERAEHWMDWAIRQALAGPNEPTDAEQPTPTGTPVEKLVATRYRSLLIAHHREVTGARRQGERSHRADADQRGMDAETYRRWRDDAHRIDAMDDQPPEDHDFISLDELYDKLGFSRQHLE